MRSCVCQWEFMVFRVWSLWCAREHRGRGRCKRVDAVFGELGWGRFAALGGAAKTAGTSGTRMALQSVSLETHRVYEATTSKRARKLIGNRELASTHFLLLPFCRKFCAHQIMVITQSPGAAALLPDQPGPNTLAFCYPLNKQRCGKFTLITGMVTVDISLESHTLSGCLSRLSLSVPFCVNMPKRQKYW